MEAPALPEYANGALAKGFLVGDADLPELLVPTVDGAFQKITELMDLQITGGSTSIQATGVYGMRVAGAAARELLSEAAAQAWSVPALSRLPSLRVLSAIRRVVVPPRLLSLRRLHPCCRHRPYPDSSSRKNSPSWVNPNLDWIFPPKVDGSAVFGIDVIVPDMKYAAVHASPVFGGTVASIDDSKARSMPGVRDVVSLDNAVAVVADGYWQAQQALKTVQVEFADTHANTVNQESIFEQFANALDTGEGNEDLIRGDVSAAFTEAETVLEAEYRVPYLAHATMEPLNATARISDGQCELWTGSQNPLGFRSAVAEALDLPVEKVTVHNQYLGGGFGRRANPDYAVQAARIAQACGHPVQLIWSREEDTRQDRYRPAVLSRFKAGFDAQGKPVAWQNHFVDKHEPAEATHIPYAIANLDVRDFVSPTHVPFGAWRSVDHSQHSFFTESFIDEMAHDRGVDPYQFRRDLLGHNARLRSVLDKAAEMANWSEPRKPGWGRGIALQASFGTLVAQVLDVEVVAGKVRVDRVFCAVDPGFAVSPDGLIAQMESGILYGLTAALYGDISIENGAVAQSNFHDYKMVRMSESPNIETQIIVSGEKWGGAGEPGTPTVAPALANAIYDATGTRIRQLPIKNYDLEFRIEERDEAV